ncbi:MAG TPA: hypothetical protein VFF73_27515 [Planctomycetota bacterium]|nr:hypothetical protein [Planctomycetota bacterium]
MTRTLVALGVGAFLFGLVGLAVADDAERYELKPEPGSVQGAIVKLFKEDQMIEFKVERVLKTDEKAEPEKTPKGLAREGAVIFLHVADARIYDDKGNELKREDKEAWFSKDKGWSALDEGNRCKIDYTGYQEMPAPKGFPAGARAGGNILVYHVTDIHLLSKGRD